MSREDRDCLPPDLRMALRDVIEKLEQLSGLDRPRQASLLASAIVEFSAFETALNGQSLEAARLIQIATELDRLGKDRH